jgi:pimeloyl-ACP methyl ester carboxylesterase
MSIAQTGRITLYYESTGHGTPLVLLSGVGFGSWIWRHQITPLAKHFRVIAFDNRGIGQSDKPDEPYTIETLARDTVALLDALKISQAHLLGVSLGGMVALQLALDHPHRVLRLILCSTAFGGPNTVLPSLEVLQFMATPGGDPEERFARGIRFSFGSSFLEKNPAAVAFIRQKMTENRQPEYAYRRQVMAPLGFNVEMQLQQIQKPTLILAGDQDQAVPVENARRLAEKIPSAQLQIFWGAGHLCFIEQADAFNQAVLGFLKEST